MRIIRTKDYKDLSRKTANILSAQVILKPNCVLGLATGSSPLGTYEQLVEWYDKGDIDFSQVTSINLDEYRGLTHDHAQSYWYFMQTHFFSRINIQPDHVHVPDGANPDAEAACRAYDRIIEEAGGIDCQLLGIGLDGHIGFNEPADAFQMGTHCVRLTQSTIEANKRFFSSADEVPREAYTMGVRNIMQARKVLLIASGSGKAAILKQAFFGPVTPRVPASILQIHTDFTLIADEAALSEIDAMHQC